MDEERFIIDIGADASKFHSEVKRVKQELDSMAGTVSIGFDVSQSDTALKHATNVMDNYKRVSTDTGRKTNELTRKFSELDKQLKSVSIRYNNINHKLVNSKFTGKAKDVFNGPEFRADRQFRRGSSSIFRAPYTKPYKNWRLVERGTSFGAKLLGMPELAAQQKAKINPKPQDITPREALARFKGMAKAKTYSSVFEDVFGSTVDNKARGNILNKVYITAKESLAKYNRELEFAQANKNKLQDIQYNTWQKKGVLEDRRAVLLDENKNSKFAIGTKGPEAINTEIANVESLMMDADAQRKADLAAGTLKRGTDEYRNRVAVIQQYKRELFELKSLEASGGTSYEVAAPLGNNLRLGATGSGEIRTSEQFVKNEEELRKIDKAYEAVNDEINAGEYRLRVVNTVLDDIHKKIRAIIHDLQQDPDKKAWNSKELERYTIEWERQTEKFQGDIPTGKMMTAFKRLGQRIKIQTINIFANWLNPIYVLGRAINGFLSQNIKYANTFKVVAYNLTRVLEPLVKRIVDWALKLLQYVNILTKEWMGIDLFDKSYMTAKKMTEELKDVTASFDELHPIGENNETLMDTGGLPELNLKWKNQAEEFAKSFKPWAKKIGEWLVGAAENPLKTLFRGFIALEVLKLGKLFFLEGIKYLFGRAWTALLGGKAVEAAAGATLGKHMATGGATLGVLSGGKHAKGLGLGGKILGTLGLVGGTALSVGTAANAGTNWEDMSGAAKAGSVALSGIGAGIAGLSAGLLFSNPVGWAVGIGVALTSFVVGMSQAQNGIKSLKKESEEWENTQVDLAKAVEESRMVADEYDAALINLKELEEQTGYSGEDLAKAVEKGTLSTKNMSSAQYQVYSAYRKVQEAMTDLTKIQKTENELVAKEAKDALDVIFRNAEKADSYDDLAMHINKAWQDGKLSTEEARDAISRYMGEMSESARTELLGKLEPALQQGLDYEKYQSGWHGFWNFWKEMWGNMVGETDKSCADMTADMNSLIETTDALKDAREKQTEAENNLTLAEQAAGMTWNELNTKLNNGELSVNRLTDAQRALYDAHIALETATATTTQKLQENEEQLVGNAKRTYEAGGSFQDYVKTMQTGCKENQMSFGTMEREIGLALGEMSNEERRYAEDWLRQNNLMTNGVSQATRQQMGFFRTMINNINNWISETVAKWGDWWADILPGGETSQTRQIKREIESIQNNPYYSEEEKKRLIANLSATMPSYAVGTNYVPNDQLAMIHKGEAIIPAKYNTYNRSARPQLNEGDSGLQATIQLLVDTTDKLNGILDAGIPVKGEFRQRGSDLYATVEKARSRQGINGLSDVSFAR